MIYQSDTKVESLVVQLKVFLDLHKPVNKHSSHTGGDVSLFCQVAL